MRRILFFASVALILLKTSLFSVGIDVPEDYTKINDAIQAANPGMYVYVGPGVYDRTTQDFPIVMKDGVSVKGRGMYRTFIDNSGTGAPAFLAQNINTTNTLIIELTVQNGNLPASGGTAVYIEDCQVLYLMDARFRGNTGTRGGAVYIDNSTVYITRCIFEDNIADYGGAMYIEDPSSTPLIVGNDFRGNRALQSGGAFFIRQASGTGIYGNTFENNQSSVMGGAVMIQQCSPPFLDNILRDNTSVQGGGLTLDRSSSAVERNRIYRNRADHGGGIYSTASSAGVQSNEIAHNMAVILGGAYLGDANSDKFLNNTVHHNVNTAAGGAAVSLDNSSAELIQNSVAFNRSEAGIGLLSSSGPVYNNIIAFNTGAGLEEYDAGSDPNCRFNLFYRNGSANYMDEGVLSLVTETEINSANNAPNVCNSNIVGDPAFRDAGMGDFHIRAVSAARDVATLTPPTFPEQDIDQEIRKDAYSGPGPDIGADELTFPHLVDPTIYYDLDVSDSVTTGDLVILTFNRSMDSPTTIKASDFDLPVVWDSLGTAPTIWVSDDNPKQVFIELGSYPTLTIDDLYSDGAIAPGSPSGIEVGSSRLDGLQDEEGLPATHLGPPGPPSTAFDITIALGEDLDYTHWYSSSFLRGRNNGYLRNTTLDIPILSSYYAGFITMRQTEQYFGTITATAFESDYGIHIFDPFNPPTLTLEYSETEIDSSKGEREENMRLFRLNRNNPNNIFFELVPDARGKDQVVDTENNTVSVDLVYLFTPRNSTYDSPIKIPVDYAVTDRSKGIYAVFNIQPFETVQKRANPAPYSSSVSLSTSFPDQYERHEVSIRGFEEDTSGTVLLTLRKPGEREHEMFSDKSNALFVIEATNLDGVTPFDVLSTASIILNYKDRLSDVFTKDVSETGGVKASEPQLELYCLNADDWILDPVTGDEPGRDPVYNRLTADAPPSCFFNGRAVIGAAADPQTPFAYQFLYDEEDWHYASNIGEFDSGVPGSGPGYLSIASASDYTYSFWESDPDELPVVEGYLYRARIPVNTNIFSQVTCPSFRIRINPQHFQLNPMMRVMSNREGYASPTTLVTKIYDMYFIPPLASLGATEEEDDLQVSFDLVNLDENDTPDAALFFRGIEFDRVPLDSLSTKATLADYNFTGSKEGWKEGNAYPVFTPPLFSETGQSIYMGVVNNNTYGFWEKDTEIQITTDTLYCVRFFIYTDVPDRSDTPDVRFRVTTKSFMHVAMLREQNSGDADMAPLMIPREYRLYFYPEQELLVSQTRETIIISVDLINLSDKADAGTGIYIDRVILETLDPPVWPDS